MRCSGSPMTRAASYSAVRVLWVRRRPAGEAPLIQSAGGESEANPVVSQHAQVVGLAIGEQVRVVRMRSRTA